MKSMAELSAMFVWVGDFSASGLAPARERGNGEHRGGALHIDHDGKPAYERRFKSVGSFRQGRAPAEVDFGVWVYIDVKGNNVSEETFLLAGEFFEDRARVCKRLHEEFHINLDIKPAYDEIFSWVSPYEGGEALVGNRDGSTVRIGLNGQKLHKKSKLS